MNIEKSPQYELHTFTKLLNQKKEDLVPPNCDNRCVYSTIINRCYYSSYLYSLLWLEDRFKFKLKEPYEFDNKEDFITEHKQVRLALKDKGFAVISSELVKLSSLRKKADYDPFSDISDDELQDAIDGMNFIFRKLTF
ncbi:MAG: hypothetical protein E7Z77_02425 [Methanobrevibacter sp.]|uniref:hypothetical protein n=1 Tax=Methanobrevibacter sp. TaxID=66852 RepID=UPI0025E36CEE|nr:hypothetical protein [Methanobrevibacter sp.]MBE6508250.1 hypothetical protein [Methanobrevibacter sp.]